MNNWDQYAIRWQAEKQAVIVEDASVAQDEKQTYLKYLGDEWGNKSAVDQFVADFIASQIRADNLVVEIGSGGGRIAARVAPLCRTLVCLDVSKEMLRLCREATNQFGNVLSVQIPPDCDTLPLADGSAACFYSFDTCVHLDQRQIFRYLREAARVLTPEGKAVFHIASHETKLGWQHFVASVAALQGSGTFASFAYIDSRAFRRMASMVGLKVLDDSRSKPGNFYYDRDMVFLLGRQRDRGSWIGKWRDAIFTTSAR